MHVAQLGALRRIAVARHLDEQGGHRRAEIRLEQQIQNLAALGFRIILQQDRGGPATAHRANPVKGPASGGSIDGNRLVCPGGRTGVKCRTPAKNSGNRGGDFAGGHAGRGNESDEFFHECWHCETAPVEFKGIFEGGFQFYRERIAGRAHAGGRFAAEKSSARKLAQPANWLSKSNRRPPMISSPAECRRAFHVELQQSKQVSTALRRVFNFFPILERCRQDGLLAQPPANQAAAIKIRTAPASFPNTVQANNFINAFSETGNGNRVSVQRDTPVFRRFPLHLAWNVRICGQNDTTKTSNGYNGVGRPTGGLGCARQSFYSLPFAGHSPDSASLRCVFQFSSLRVWWASASTGWQPGRAG